MIKLVVGDMFSSGCDTLVNPVNCVGVLGKGLALAFRQRFPADCRTYQKMCHLKKMQVGRVLMTQETNHRIIHFPTKDHWLDPSKLEYIQEGMENLVPVLQTQQIYKIAIPALGCGCGNLKWEEVYPLMLYYLEPVKSMDIRIYAPLNQQPSYA